MEDGISKIEQRIIQLKQKKEKMQTHLSVLLFKEAKIILGDNFSTELVLNVLSNSWNTSSSKQKEEWVNSAHLFRHSPTKGKSNKIPNPQKKNPQTTPADL
jgi:hypothetical protein